MDYHILKDQPKKLYTNILWDFLTKNETLKSEVKLKDCNI